MAGVVLAVVEVVRQLLERQAVRRMEAGTLSDAETERVGRTLMQLEASVRQLIADCGADPREVRALADRLVHVPELQGASGRP